MSYNNKFDLKIEYDYKIDMKDNPLYSLNQFNVNTVFYMLETICSKVFKEGRKNPNYFYNRKKGMMEGDRYYIKLWIKRIENMWIGEKLVWDNYVDFKDDVANHTIESDGFCEYSLKGIFKKIADMCKKWDERVYTDVALKTLNRIVDNFKILSMDELK